MGRAYLPSITNYAGTTFSPLFKEYYLGEALFNTAWLCPEQDHNQRTPVLDVPNSPRLTCEQYIKVSYCITQEMHISSYPTTSTDSCISPTHTITEAVEQYRCTIQHQHVTSEY